MTGGALWGHQGLDTLSPLALMVRTESDACQHPVWTWLSCTPGLSYLCKWQRCPGLHPVPLTHQRWNDIGFSSHTEADSSAHSLGKLQKEQGRWEENGSWAALPSFSQALAAKPQLRSQTYPTILLSSWTQPTARGQSPIWPPPILASLPPCTHLDY